METNTPKEDPMKTIKRNSTDETNISARTITYDCYENDTYLTTFADINDALDWKESKGPFRFVKENSTNEVNVSKRHVWYDCYEDGKYIICYDDVLEAIKWRDAA
jgi:hypothetical protein